MMMRTASGALESIRLGFGLRGRRACQASLRELVFAPEGEADDEAAVQR
ncbi:MAG: hypothetical protein JWO85_1523 [Candidatus Eremiobacteraeota bacterium]|nr:hypothetical protein [Candidatus Eremiobacteraeota bacterium]